MSEAHERIVRRQADRFLVSAERTRDIAVAVQRRGQQEGVGGGAVRRDRRREENQCCRDEAAQCLHSAIIAVHTLPSARRLCYPDPIQEVLSIQRITDDTVKKPNARLGEVLQQKGRLAQEQTLRALRNQKVLGGRLGTCLLEIDAVTEEELLRALSDLHGVPFASPEDLRNIPPEVIAQLTPKVAQRCQAIPFHASSTQIKVAVTDASDLSIQDEVTFVVGRRVRWHVATEVRIVEALERYYGVESATRVSKLLDRLNRNRFMWSRESSDEAGAETMSVPAWDLPAPKPAPPDGAQPAPPPSPYESVTPAPPEPAKPETAEIAKAERPGATTVAVPEPAKPAALPAAVPPPPQPLPAAASPLPPAPPVPVAEPKPAVASPPAPPTQELRSAAPKPEPAAEAPPPEVAASAPVVPVMAEEAEGPPSDDDTQDLVAGETASALSLSQAEQLLLEPKDRDSVARTVVRFASSRTRRAVLLVVRKQEIAAWLWSGEGLNGPGLAAFKVGLDETSIFHSLQQGAELHRGALAPVPAHTALLANFDPPVHATSLVTLPIRVRNRLVAVLVAERSEDDFSDEMISDLKRIGTKAAIAFELCIMRSKLRSA